MNDLIHPEFFRILLPPKILVGCGSAFVLFPTASNFPTAKSVCFPRFGKGLAR